MHILIHKGGKQEFCATEGIDENYKHFGLVFEVLKLKVTRFLFYIVLFCFSFVILDYHTADLLHT